MKKMFCVSAALLIAGLYASANSAIPATDFKSGTNKELRKEKRQERKEAWLHSASLLAQSQFDSDFPNAKDVSWIQGHFEEATFIDNGIVKTAFYDDKSELVGTTSDVDFFTLPEKARKFIENKYPDYKVESSILFDDNEANDTDMFLYDSSFEDEDTYFVELSGSEKTIILKVTMDGDVSAFNGL